MENNTLLMATICMIRPHVDEFLFIFVQSMEISKPTPPFENHVYDAP
jgi:hypothetical protein